MAVGALVAVGAAAAYVLATRDDDRRATAPRPAARSSATPTTSPEPSPSSSAGANPTLVQRLLDTPFPRGSIPQEWTIGTPQTNQAVNFRMLGRIDIVLTKATVAPPPVVRIAYHVFEAPSVAFDTYSISELGTPESVLALNEPARCGRRESDGQLTCYILAGDVAIGLATLSYGTSVSAAEVNAAAQTSIRHVEDLRTDGGATN